MSYTLHAVVVKKPITLNKAKKTAKHFITDKPLKFRETEQSYRFQNYPKEEFEPKTFRTKKLNEDVSLIYGKHKEGKDEMVEGGNIFNDMFNKVAEFLFPYNPLVRNIKYAINKK